MQVLFSDFVSFSTTAYSVLNGQTDGHVHAMQSLNIMVIQNYPDLAIQSLWNATRRASPEPPRPRSPPPLILEPYARIPHIPHQSISPTALRTTVTIQEERG